MRLPKNSRRYPVTGAVNEPVFESLPAPVKHIISVYTAQPAVKKPKDQKRSNEKICATAEPYVFISASLPQVDSGMSLTALQVIPSSFFISR